MEVVGVDVDVASGFCVGGVGSCGGADGCVFAEAELLSGDFDVSGGALAVIILILPASPLPNVLAAI